MPEMDGQKDLRARALFALTALASWDTSAAEFISMRRAKPDVPHQILNPEFERKIKRDLTGKFDEKPRASLPDVKKKDAGAIPPPPPGAGPDPLEVRAKKIRERVEREKKLKQNGVIVVGPVTPVMQEHLDDYELIPDAVKKKMADLGLRVVIQPGAVTDRAPEYKGVIPRGWEGTGYTWDDVPGTYFTEDKEVVAGASPNGLAGHGSVSLLLHEYGHGVDYSTGNPSQSDDFKKLHSQVSWKEPYFQQGEGAGAEEVFGELFSLLKMTPEERVKMMKHMAEDPNDLAKIQALYAIVMKNAGINTA